MQRGEKKLRAFLKGKVGRELPKQKWITQFFLKKQINNEY